MEYPKLKPEVKKEWIAALRSGKYEQGVGRLRSLNDEYCCLGVLCETQKIPYRGGGYIFRRIREIAELDNSWFMGNFKRDRYPTELEVAVYNIQKALTDLNDAKLLTFNRIADWIETNL